MPCSRAYFVNSAVLRIPNLRITFDLWNDDRCCPASSPPRQRSILGPWCAIRWPAQGPATLAPPGRQGRQEPILDTLCSKAYTTRAVQGGASFHWPGNTRFNSGDSCGRMAELSRGNRFAGYRCPQPSCQFKGAHVQPRRVAPHHFAAKLVGVFAHGVAARSIPQ